MNPPKSVSISGYGAYVPKHRIASSEIAKVWKGGKDAFHIEKAVASSDEDTITMAVESSRKAISMANFPKLGAIFVGTESKPYAVKPSGTILAQALDQHETLTADFEFACKAGTESMQAIFGLVGSGMIDNGLAVGVDTAQGRPGDALEYTAASASASYVISKKDKKTKKYDKKNPILRTKEERKNEVKIIINKLTELELTISYKPIKELFEILQKYTNEGGKIPINIPFPMINRRIKGILADTINENCIIQLIHENL